MDFRKTNQTNAKKNKQQSKQLCNFRTLYMNGLLLFVIFLFVRNFSRFCFGNWFLFWCFCFLFFPKKNLLTALFNDSKQIVWSIEKQSRQNTIFISSFSSDYVLAMYFLVPSNRIFKKKTSWSSSIDQSINRMNQSNKQMKQKKRVEIYETKNVIGFFLACFSPFD